MKIITLILLALFGLTAKCQTSSTNDTANSTAPYIDTLIVKIDSKIYLEFVALSENNYEFIALDNVKDSTKTVIINFRQDANFGTVLDIKNLMNQTFSYKAFLYHYKKKKYIETNVYPVRKKLGALEMWPNKLDHILITDLKILVDK